MARLRVVWDVLEEAEALDNAQRRALRKRLREDGKYNAFQYLSDDEFIETYRLNKTTASALIHELEPHLPAGVRSTSVPVVSKILTAIAFYANGSYQRGIGQCTQHSIVQQTVSKCIRQVTEAFNSEEMRNRYIRFPQTQEERNVIKRGFYDKFHIPGVLGCVDGTHIAIIRPVEHEEWYYNRKNFHSLNAQIICDSDLNIISVDASYSGSNHDSFIWEHHPLRQYIEQLHRTEATWFLGDSGYSQRKWMMTPILDAAADSPEAYYTERQMSARNTVERTIGLLKARWRCLLVHRVLHYDPVTAGMMANACVILHNIANAARLPVPRLPDQEAIDEHNFQEREYHDDEAGVQANRIRNHLLVEGRAMRDNLVRRIWQNRRN